MFQKALKPILWISILTAGLGMALPPLLLGDRYHNPISLWEQALYYFAAVYIFCVLVWRIVTLIREKRASNRQEKSDSKP